jgi:hypothetical protein
MSNESKALELARELSRQAPKGILTETHAADELRRQHAEIESLRAQLAARVPDDAAEAIGVIRGIMSFIRTHSQGVKGFEPKLAEERVNKRLDQLAAMLSAAPSQQAPVAQGEPSAAAAWAQGYRQGIDDERTSEANIGIAGFGAKVEPARQNPYANTHPQQARNPAASDGMQTCDVLRSIWNAMQNSADADDLLSRLEHMRGSIDLAVSKADSLSCIKAKHTETLSSGTVVTRLELTDRAKASLCANVGAIPAGTPQQDSEPMTDADAFQAGFRAGYERRDAEVKGAFA